MGQWRALVNGGMKFRISGKAKYILNSRITTSFSKKDLVSMELIKYSEETER
jgi:hypothetical protein